MLSKKIKIIIPIINILFVIPEKISFLKTPTKVKEKIISRGLKDFFLKYLHN